jgi:hypothetical protein
MAEDGTSEFLSLARRLAEGSQPSLANSTHNNSKVGGLRQNRNCDSSYEQLLDFHTTPGGISRDIAVTSSMLKDLTQPVRQKSFFQDDTPQVNELVALTTLFGMALNWDLWGGQSKAASPILEALASRYGRECVASGYILHSQTSVQSILPSSLYYCSLFFLAVIKRRYCNFQVSMLY